MHKNTELRSSILYFVDEAIGFRKSIHHFHRWLEFNEQDELERLIIEIGYEQFVDLRALVSAVKHKNDIRIASALDNINSFGFFKTPESFEQKCHLKEKVIYLKLLLTF